MISKHIKILILFIVFLFSMPIYAQQQLPNWAQKMYEQNADIEDVTTLYEAYFKANKFVKDEHTQYYKRWLRNISRDLTGEFNSRLSDTERAEIKREADAYQQKIQEDNRRQTGSWIGIGPFDWDHDAASKSYAPGAAHIYTIEQALSDPNILFAGTATAGLWKSVDHGISWDCMTCHLMENRVYAVDIHPTNPNILLADLFNSVHKSTDGGVTWTPTGDATFQTLSMSVYDLFFHPNNGMLAFAATSEGLFRTDDQGSNWSEVILEKTMEIELHPTKDSILYVIEQVGDGTKFYKSEDLGNTFTHQPTGWPTPTSPDANRRAEIAVSAASPDKVIALLTGSVNGGNGLYGIYTSTDRGANWSFECCGPQPGGVPDLNTVPPNINMMGWSDVGSDDGGQYYYDLGLAISQTNSDSIYVGGVNLWISGDGGSSFICPSKWSHSSKPNYVHADIHDINFYDNGEIWLACDGGIFYSDDNGANFERRMTGIQGSDFWGFGANYWSGNVMLGGAYHNGTLIMNDSAYINGWHCIDGGDGTGGWANPGLEKRVYSNYNVKDLPQDRLTPIPTRGYAVKPYSHYIVGRTSQMAFHPNNYSHQYFGKDNCLYRTTDDNYAADTVFCFGEAVADVEVSWVNPDYIYVSTFMSHWGEKKIYKSTDVGQSWTDITPSNAVFSSKRWIPYDLTLSDQDPDIIYMARVANSVTTYDGQKVYKSINGGDSWINLTTAVLDGEQLTNIVYQRGTQEGLWVGTRRTVFYNSNNLTDWMLCNSDLPASTFSTKLVINYRTSKIRNATNRSVYELPLVEPSNPVAVMTVDKTDSQCARDTFYFTDYSVLSESGATWSWSFPGASYVSSSTTRTTKVVFGNSGLYTVSLSVTDNTGSDMVTMNDYISVSDKCNADTFPGKALRNEEIGDYAQMDLDLNTRNFTVSAWIKPIGIQPQYAGILIADGTTAGLNFKTNNKLGYHWPGGQYWWDSNLTVPVNKWSHVALVAHPTGITIYLNGIADHHAISLDTAFMETGYIGTYKGWNSRNYLGDIDEVSIWNRSLSVTEIRELMHITRDKIVNGPGIDNSFIAYYQFNEEEGNIIYDRAGLRHGSLTTTEGRMPSTAPVGGGSSSTINVNSVGTYTFTNENIRLAFNSASHVPNSPVVVSKIIWLPHLLPGYDLLNEYYFAVHAFNGSSELIIDSVFVQDDDVINNECSDHFIFSRTFYDEGNTWIGPHSLSENCESNWLYFPSQSYPNGSQIAITHYDGNYYVDEANPSIGDGRSWESAFKQLQPAINLAGNTDTIFVAQGTYIPRQYARDCINCTSERSRSIHPRSGLTMLGGFPTFGSPIANRNWQLHQSIISGTWTEDQTLNTYHTLYVDSFSTDITIDGFYVKEGRANGLSAENKKGSALYAKGGLNLSNMDFSNHFADNSIIYINGLNANVNIENTNVQNNTAGSLILDVDGGAKVLIDPESEIEE